jgi:hypothetical protein
MTLKTDWIDGNILYADDLNDNFLELNLGISPIGSVQAWLKSLTNTPALPESWVECNGQTIDDSDSVYDGITLPDLNGTSDSDKLFLRGATSSGGTGGSASDSFSWQASSGIASGGNPNIQYVEGSKNGTKTINTIPPYYEVVWIIRIK